MAKTASLTSGLLIKKGNATPADVAQAKSKVPEAPPVDTVENKGKGNEYHKALTVKLDRDRYMRLKQMGLQKDKSSQEIFIEALDAYLNDAEA